MAAHQVLKTTHTHPEFLLNDHMVTDSMCELFFSQDRIDGITIQARQFQEAGHFDADNIRKKQEALVVRYEALREPMAARKQKLSDSLRLQQLFRDVEDEETWIREKEPIAASTNRGKYAVDVEDVSVEASALPIISMFG